MNSSSGKSDSYQSCEFQGNLDILRQTYFFSGLPIEALKVFAYLCGREEFKAGDHLFHQDDQDGLAYYIISGKALLTRNVSGEEAVVRTYQAGDFLGGLTLLGNYRRLFGLKAETDTQCLIISKEKFDSTVNQFPDLLSRIISEVVAEINAWEEARVVGREEGAESKLDRFGVSLV
jgi:CRP-like cAMP-binding protein